MTELMELIEKSRKYDETKHDYKAATGELHFDESLKLNVSTNFGGMAVAVEPMSVTDHAMSQMCSKLGPTVFGQGSNKSVPTEYIRALPKKIAADNLNSHLGKANKRWMVRANGSNVRAVMDGEYPVVGNTYFMESLQHGLQTKGMPKAFRIRSDYVTPDRMDVQTMWADVHGGSYGIGVYLGNDEIGMSSIKLWPMIKRTSCDNSIVMRSADGITKAHRGNTSALRAIIVATLVHVLEIAGEGAERMIQAEYEEIPDFDQVLGKICKQHGWEGQVRDSIFEGTEKSQTRQGIVNGISWAAHQAHMTREERLDMQVLAGDYLMAPVHEFARLAR